jgi:hypothetical protein
VSPEWDYEIAINADGFRDDVLLKDLPSGSAVFAGDSFIEGYGLPLTNSVPSSSNAFWPPMGSAG